MLIVAVPLNATAVTQNVFSYTVSNGQATIVYCDKSAKGELKIPDTLGGFPVTGIEGSAFDFCDGLTSITVPASVKSIGDGAFQGSAALKSIYVDSGNPAYSSENGVLFNKSKTELLQCPTGKTGQYTISSSVKSIKVEAFFLSYLTSVTIPNSVKSIGNRAFDSCSSLKSVKISDGVKSIGDLAFCSCEKLKSITIPNSVTKIGDGAFLDSYGLTSISVSKENKDYTSENGVLFNKSKTELIQYPASKTGSSYAIPNSVTSIGSFAFCFCEGLKSVNIPNSVKNIGEQAFHSCIKLKSVTIPNSVTSIGYRSFWETAWYNNQPDGLIYAGKVAYYYKGNIPDNTAIVLKPGTKGIADGAFEPEASEEDNIGLIGVIIPNSVTNIGEQAFANCSGLKNVTIPKSVVSIGEQAFGFDDYGFYEGKITDFTINCFANSAGQRYAKENRFTYNILPASAAARDPAVTAGNSGMGNRITVTAVIFLTMLVFLALAVTAVFIITKKKKKNKMT